MERNDDFKYILQDTGHVYIGKELTYEELAEKEDVPFKLKAIIKAHIVKDTSLDRKLSEHILYIDKEQFSYQIFEQLKMQIRLFYKEEKKGFGGKMKEKWIHKTCTLDVFCKEYREAVTSNKAIIEDISISKLALMTISI